MKTLLLFAILCLSLSATAQVTIDKINLNNYKTTDYQYKQLYLNASFGGNIIQSTAVYIADTTIKNNQWSNSNSFKINAHYLVYENSRKKQISRKISFLTNPYYKFGRDNKNKKIHNLKINNGFYYDEYNRSYSTDRFFFHKGLNISFNQDYKDETRDKYDSHYIYLSVKLPLLIGWGRIEIVSNAWRAYRIVKDLKRYNLFNENTKFDEQSVFQIADYITRRNFTRAFDYREKFKEDMIGLTNKFFRDNADISNPVFYASLYDMWNYSINDIRRTGSALSLGIQPEFKYNYDFSNRYGNDLMVTSNVDLFILAKYEKYKALNINWQLDFVASLKSGIINLYYSDNDYHTKKIKPYIYPSIHLGIGFYPNTRTSFNSYIDLGNSLEFSDFGFEDISNSFRYNFSNTLNYYISPKIRFGAYFQISNTTSFNGYHISYSKYQIGTKYGVKYSISIF